MKKLLITLLIILAISRIYAQVDRSSNLYQIIMSKDSLLFNVGFNTCDIAQFEKLLSNNFEFYHDKDGVSDKNTFLNNLKKGLCKNPEAFQARRELQTSSCKIFALYKDNQIYGAIQEGTHLFFETQKGQPDYFGSSARFTHLWLLENNEWKLTKSYSYEHNSNKFNPAPTMDNDSEIEEWLKANNVPVLGLGIIKNGKISRVSVFGSAYNTIFNVASLTKPITAAVVLKLVAIGKLHLDEPIHKYWTDPDIANDPRSKKLTPRLILSHQTGFENWRWLNEDGKLSFDFEPGERYQYSGEGYEYLRKALEHKFKKPLQQLADELIFQPLKMTDTRYVWDKDIDVSRYALNFDKDGNAYEIVKNATANSADDLLTTIEDYATFLTNVMDGSLLPEKIFNEMATPQVASERGKHFGLGFERYDFENGVYALAHGGADDGVRTIVFMLPKSKQGLLIFTNADTGVNLYEHLIKIYLGELGQKIIDIETK